MGVFVFSVYNICFLRHGSALNYLGYNFRKHTFSPTLYAYVIDTKHRYSQTRTLH